MTRQKRLQGRLEVGLLKFDQHCESNLNTDIKATELSVRITGVCVTDRRSTSEVSVRITEGSVTLDPPSSPSVRRSKRRYKIGYVQPSYRCILSLTFLEGGIYHKGKINRP